MTEKQTLKFDGLIDMAAFSKQLSSGYLMNTTNCTLTGNFSPEQIGLAVDNYHASVIDTTDKVFGYGRI